MNAFANKNWLLALLIRDWKSFVVLLTPIFLMWLPLMANTSEARCGYVIMIMAIYYMIEALPLGVTALIPVFAFPFLGILSTDAICRVYMRGTVMMFFGGLAVAIAVEHCNLHKRIALFVILKVGQSPRRLMLSFMFTSMILSMFISNTAAAAMMVPILDAILQELYKLNSSRKSSRQEEISTIESCLHMKHSSQLELVDMTPIKLDSAAAKRKYDKERELEVEAIASSHHDGNLLPPDEDSQALSTMCFLAIAYGSDLGGVGFPTGTSPNLILWGILQSSFPGGTGLDFATWMAFNIPGMLICICVCWIWLEILFMGFCGHRKMAKTSKDKENAIRNLVQKHYESLGTITFHEISVSILFGILVVLWVFRAPEFITGWANLIEGAFENDLIIGNASPAILVMILLFVFPSKAPWKNNSNEPTPACLSWDAIHKKVPWGIILLMGGGFAMAEGSTASGLSKWMETQLQGLESLPGPTIVFLVCIITAFLTEVVSNATAASILLPVLKDMSTAAGLHPLYLMLPTAISCSYAFMLPVSNPPNAIAFNASTMKNSDMIKAGFVLKLLCVLVLTILTNTLGVAIFGLDTYPSWAPERNVTLIDINTIENSTLISYSIFNSTNSTTY